MFKSFPDKSIRVKVSESVNLGPELFKIQNHQAYNNSLSIIKSHTNKNVESSDSLYEVTFGDEVSIMDYETKEYFPVRIELNRFNKSLITPIEIELLGKKKGSIFEFKGAQILSIGNKQK